jgi:hypothetical protein
MVFIIVAGAGGKSHRGQTDTVLNEKFNPSECDRVPLSTFRSSRENPRRLIRNFFLEHRECAGRSSLARFPAAYRRVRDPHTVAIHVQDLIGQAHEDDDRTSWR